MRILIRKKQVMNKYSPEQFEILGNELDLNIIGGRGYVKGKRKYARIFIKNKHPEESKYRENNIK